MASDLETRIRNVTAVLGPTNTGKTHLAIERMLGHETGMIGLPLRLLAREVYDKIAARIGADKVALITGEEKIKPERARYWVSTVEAMPRDVDVDFLAIDEIQLAADPERGHVFTDRLLHSRGRAETLLLGAHTMRDAISDLIPGANFISRTRFSQLTYAGEKKITRLPGRTAVVAFSANEVYAIAELIRRQRGGTAVVLGALSPRTRNAQVELYQSGDVDFLVATDAIGMGLNLDVDHVAFSAIRKFDGHTFRNLTPGEVGQIAGRAGRPQHDGTVGGTRQCDPVDAAMIERLEKQTFAHVRVLQWRNRELDFGSLDRLRDSLREIPNSPRLSRARMADDVIALETLANDREIARLASGTAAVSRLWEVCQIPDYRKISSQNHAELVGTLYGYLMSPEGRVPEDWFAKQVAFADRTDGDIDTLANRIAHIRTWTFVSNRADWLRDPQHWQARTREIEDALSDALHTCLTQRFVDSRTSALMKGLRDKEELTAEIGEDGAIRVETHFVGRLTGFQFFPETQGDTSIHGRATRSAAAHVLSRELGMRARRVAAAKSDAFRLSRAGRVLWRDEEIAKFEAADDPLKPQVSIIADEHLSAPDREKVQARIEAWRDEIVAERLKPLVDIAKAEDVTGLARGIAFRLTESFGMLKRELVADMMKHLDQKARSELRKYGVRFGAFNIYFPSLLKPAPAELSATLWALKHGAEHGLSIDALPEMPRPGLTSTPALPEVPEALYRAHGFHVCGPRSVRIDILERLADLIRPLLAWRASPESASAPPKGSTGDGGFVVTPEMMSILGCSPEELSNVLKVLGFRLERKTVPKPATPETQEATAADGETAAPAAAPADLAAAQAGDATAATAEAPLAPVSSPDAQDTLAGHEEAVAAAAEGGQAAPEPASGDTSPAAAETAPDAPANEAADTLVIEIWRPRRHRHGDERHHGRREGGGPPQRGRRRGGPQRDARSGPNAPATPEGQPSQNGETAAAAPSAPSVDRPHRERERGRDRPQRDHRDHNDRNRAKGGRPPRDGKPGGDRRRDDRRRHDERQGPTIRSASPPKKGGVDPDSPFASLSALRDALAKQTQEKNSS